ncbi:MAG: AI-2E family transporter [Oscillospiraceae bacterium]|nr:AI-2E family transporter [Oscillospiraceae bacterium]
MHIDKKLLRNLFFVAGGCVVLAWLLLDTERVTALLSSIWGLFSPFVAGAAIAFIFNVPMRAIEGQLEGIKKEGLRRGLAIILTILVMVLVIMFVVELLVPQIGLTVDSLKERIPAFVERTGAKLMEFMEANPEIKNWVYETTDLEKIDWPSLLQKALTVIGEGITSVMGSAFSVIGNVTDAVVNTVISIVFALYCLSRKDILARQGRRILYSFVPEKAADETIRIFQLTNSTFSNFISGQCLEACILGCLFAVAMAIFKMPYIPLVSVVIAVTALIPVVGAFVGCIVGAFFILVNDPFQALTFIAMFLVLQQLENNLIYPRVVGTSIGLPGMWVLVAVTVGGEIMGVGGMLLMIPLASVLYTLAREFTDKRLAQRNIPAEKLECRPPQIKSSFQQNKERKERIRLQKMREQLKKKLQNEKKK